jgi:hypothetical protein
MALLVVPYTQELLVMPRSTDRAATTSAAHRALIRE